MIDWAAWTPAIIVAGAALFNHGQFVNRLSAQEKLGLEHHERLDEHDDKLESHAMSITRMEAWREGYNAGANKGVSK